MRWCSSSTSSLSRTLPRPSANGRLVGSPSSNRSPASIRPSTSAGITTAPGNLSSRSPTTRVIGGGVRSPTAIHTIRSPPLQPNAFAPGPAHSSSSSPSTTSSPAVAAGSRRILSTTIPLAPHSHTGVLVPSLSFSSSSTSSSGSGSMSISISKAPASTVVHTPVVASAKPSKREAEVPPPFPLLSSTIKLMQAC